MPSFTGLPIDFAIVHVARPVDAFSDIDLNYIEWHSPERGERMSGAAFSVDSVVRIIVKGELIGERDSVTGLHRRNDHGLLHRLNEFLHEQEIIPAAVHSRNACGLHVGYYSQADAERIQLWLATQGVPQE